MVVRILILLLLLPFAHTFGQKTKLALFDLTWQKDSAILENEVVVDSAFEKDEFPAFHPTEPVLYFICDSASHSIVKTFDCRSGRLRKEHSSTSKLSAARLTPDKKFISFISSPDKKLYKKSISDGRISIASKQQFRNYLWIDDNSILTAGLSLSDNIDLMTLRPEKIILVAQHAGRILQGREEGIYYVHKLSVDSWSIKRINPNGSIDIFSETLPEAEIFAIAPHDRILMVSEEKIFSSSPSGWKEVKVNGNYSHITNIGVNAVGDKLFILFAIAN
jgi:hypothetical protein